MDADGNLHFIEVNARIQVEHPVTEMVTGVDLVKSQIRIAAGERLEDILPRPVEMRGHAIECRINAEHPETFAPSPGRITGLNLPGGAGIRVDTAAYHDGVIPPYYDSLVAKLIAYGSDRDEAIARMRRALDMFVVEGIYTSIPLHRKILDAPRLRRGQLGYGLPRAHGPRRWRDSQEVGVCAWYLPSGGCSTYEHQKQTEQATPDESAAKEPTGAGSAEAAEEYQPVASRAGASRDANDPLNSSPLDSSL